MPKKEIVNTLKNAVARGASIEKAKKSMLNAGYNQAEVEQAASGIQESGDMGLTAQMPQAAAPKAMPLETKEAEAKKPGFFSKIFKRKPKPAEIKEGEASGNQGALGRHGAGGIEDKTAEHKEVAEKEKKPFPWKIVILVGILVILLGFLAFIIFRM